MCDPTASDSYSKSTRRVVEKTLTLPTVASQSQIPSDTIEISKGVVTTEFDIEKFIKD